MDILVIGSGITGATIARILAEKGNNVTIWERRNHIGGNMYDYIDEYGILVHKYGPHTFHTSKRYLYDFVLKYSEWIDYKLVCGAKIDDKIVSVPFNFHTIDTFYNKDESKFLKQKIKEEFGERKKITVFEALNSKCDLIKVYANFLFEKDYKPYTSKQWGIPLDKIDVSIFQRVPLNLSYENGYFDDKFQIMPKISYSYFFKNLLQHKNIKVVLNKDALDSLRIIGNNISLYGNKITIPVIYTGALDELFGYKYGKLPYRTLEFEWRHENIESKQPFPVVAYPFECYTRITEYKKLPHQKAQGTSYALEYSLEYNKEKGHEPYYPVMTQDSSYIYEKYKQESRFVKNLYPVGRLADFKYYNMDQALDRALEIANIL
ncbi:UDP-galactopyranose mutase [Campylobacter jejuni]|nr:UDP-galactopyranose mutase [Campylobacter jejuni]